MNPIDTYLERKIKKTGVFYTPVFASSGDTIRTYDLRVMSQNPESVQFVRRALQISRPDER